MTPCEACGGACCETIVVPLRANDPDVQRWLKFHGTPVKEGMRFDCKCSQLKDGRCLIYADRPGVCRTYEMGGDACKKAVIERRPYMKDLIFSLMETK